MDLQGPIQPRVISRKQADRRNASVAPRKGRGLTLKELIALDRPVSVEELCSALPFLTIRTVQHSLRVGRIPGVKITERKWAVSRRWLIALSEQQGKESKK